MLYYKVELVRSAELLTAVIPHALPLARASCIDVHVYHQSRNTTHHILKSCMTTREVSVCDRSSHGLASCPDFVGEFHVLAQRSGGTTPEICPVSSDWTGAPPRWCLVVLVFGASLPQWCFCTSKPTSNRAATSTSRWRLINQRIHSQYHTTRLALKLSIHPDVK